MSNAHISNDGPMHSTRAQHRQLQAHLEAVRRAFPEIDDKIRIQVAQETATWDIKGFTSPVDFWHAVINHAEWLQAQHAAVLQPFSAVERDGNVYGRNNPPFSTFTPSHPNIPKLRRN